MGENKTRNENIKIKKSSELIGVIAILMIIGYILIYYISNTLFGCNILGTTYSESSCSTKFSDIVIQKTSK